MNTQEIITALSEWIDSSPSYRGISPESADWRRIQKAVQEGAEALEAYCGMIGENPRKGQTCGLDDVLHELLDTALAALGAYEHLTGHKGTALDDLDAHALNVGRRAGLIQG